MTSLIEPGQAREFANEWIAAWNSHDLARILSHYADDFSFSSPLIARMGLGDGPLDGKQAVGVYWARGLALRPDLRFELADVLCGSGSLVLSYRGLDGRPVAEFCEFDQDFKVARASAHYGRAATASTGA